MKKLLFFAPLIVALSLHAEQVKTGCGRPNRKTCALAGLAAVVAVDTLCLTYAAANSGTCQPEAITDADGQCILEGCSEGARNIFAPLMVSLALKVPEVMAMVYSFYPREHEAADAGE